MTSVMLASETLADLIARLTRLQEQHGNLPVVYWDQHIAVKMNPEHLVAVADRTLYFGGFHVNGDEFGPQDEDPNIARRRP